MALSSGVARPQPQEAHSFAVSGRFRLCLEPLLKANVCEPKGGLWPQHAAQKVWERETKPPGGSVWWSCCEIIFHGKLSPSLQAMEQGPTSGGSVYSAV